MLRKPEGLLARKQRLLLRLAAPANSPSIARTVNHSLSTGTFPQRWKTAKITPLFKKGDASDPSNYRPISVLSVLSKVIESVTSAILCTTFFK